MIQVKKRFERMADEIENDIEQMHDNFKMLRPILMALDNVMKDQKLINLVNKMYAIY